MLHLPNSLHLLQGRMLGPLIGFGTLSPLLVVVFPSAIPFVIRLRMCKSVPNISIPVNTGGEIERAGYQGYIPDIL